MNGVKTPPKRAVFRVPFPPSVNHIWRHRVVFGRGGKAAKAKPFVQTYISVEGREYRARVVASMPPNMRPIRDRMRVVVTLCRKDRVSFDIDNFGKGLLDAISHASVWADDSLIDELEWIRGPVDPHGIGYAIVEIELLEDAQHRLFEPHEPGEILNAD